MTSMGCVAAYALALSLIRCPLPELLLSRNLLCSLCCPPITSLPPTLACFNSVTLLSLFLTPLSIVGLLAKGREMNGDNDQ